MKTDTTNIDRSKIPKSVVLEANIDNGLHKRLLKRAKDSGKPISLIIEEWIKKYTPEL